MYWTENLATGVDAIDKQHKDIINKMDEVFKSGQTGKSGEEILKVLKYLEGYVKKHFSDEEQLQIKCKYPKYQQHKIAHTQFIKSVDDLFEKFKKEGPVLTLIMDVNKTILDLFVKHITMVDKDFAKFYRENQK